MQEQSTVISEMKDITRDTPVSKGVILSATYSFMFFSMMTDSNQSFLIWTMVMAGPVACLSTTIVWLTPGSNWAFYYKVTSEYLVS